MGSGAEAASRLCCRLVVTAFEDIGGEPGLRAIIEDFIDRVVRDPMIGFLFARVNVARLKQLEYEHAAEHLGANVTYSGRDLRQAHHRHPIMGGHFGRRRQILKQVLEAHGVPVAIRAAWLSAQDALRDDVTTDQVTECNDAEASLRAERAREGDDDS